MNLRKTRAIVLGVASVALIAAAPVSSEPSLGRPQDIVIDASGAVFLVDRGSVAVLAIDPLSGHRTIVSDAMHGGGPPLPYDTPQASDRLTAGAPGPGGSLYVGGLTSLLRVDSATGDRTIVSANGVRGSGPGFVWVSGLAVEAAGTLVVPSSSNHIVLRVDVATGDRTVLSGCTGVGCVPVGTGAPFTAVAALAIGPAGAILVADSQSLVRVDPSTGDRTLVSGSTRGSGPALPTSTGVAVEPSGAVLWAHPHGILRIDPVTGDRLELSGPGAGAGPAFRAIEGIASDATGALLAADSDLGAVVRIDPGSGDRTILAGGPVGTGPRLDCLDDVNREASGALVLTSCTDGVLRVDPVSGDRSLVSGPTTGSGPAFELAGDIIVEPSGSLLVGDLFSIKRVDAITGARTIAAGLAHGDPFLYLIGMAHEAPGTVLVSDEGIQYDLLGGFLPLQLYGGVKRVDLTTGASEVVSGGGLFSARRGSGPGFLGGLRGIAVEPSGNVAAVVHQPSLLRIDPRTGDRTVVASNRVGSGAVLRFPVHLAVEAAGTWLTVDYLSNQIVRVDPATGVRTVASGISVGSGPVFEYPTALRIMPDGSLIVLNDGDHLAIPAFPFTVVMRVDLATGDRTIVSRY
jgi:streptogramin lyase